MTLLKIIALILVVLLIIYGVYNIVNNRKIEGIIELVLAFLEMLLEILTAVL